MLPDYSRMTRHFHLWYLSNSIGAKWSNKTEHERITPMTCWNGIFMQLHFQYIVALNSSCRHSNVDIKDVFVSSQNINHSLITGHYPVCNNATSEWPQRRRKKFWAFQASPEVTQNSLRILSFPCSEKSPSIPGHSGLLLTYSTIPIKKINQSVVIINVA